MADAPDAILDQISGEYIDRLWPVLEPLLRRGYAHCGVEMDAAHVLGEIKAGRRQLWAIWGRGGLLAAAVSEIAGDIAVINALGGRDMRRWVHLLDEFEELAREHGITRTRITGRKGWERVLRGYRPAYVVLEKVLGNG